MRADLHLHTVYSDGAYTPEEVAARARKNEVGLIAFTDHDVMENIEVKRAAAKKYGLKFVRGWEISAYEGDTKVHTLGYGCAADESYRAFREKCYGGARLRAEAMIERINRLCGLSLTLGEVEAERLDRNAALHVMHVARSAAARMKRDVNEVFSEYFAYGKPAYVNFARPTPEEAIDIIHRTGGIAVLAHPARIYGSEALKSELLLRLMRAGLDGIECFYSTHTESETEYYLALAKKGGLLVTGGSDFHYADGRHEVGKPEFYADERLLAALSPE